MRIYDRNRKMRNKKSWAGKHFEQLEPVLGIL